MDSILDSIKKLLGIDADYSYFDTDIIIHINTAFMTLRQLGVGPTAGFSISDSDAEWTDFLEDNAKLEMIKSYIYLRVRMLFDPPTGAAAESFNSSIKEFEWRLNVEVDPGEEIQNE